MTTAATSLLGLALPVTGELAGTWGDTVNNSITSLLDSAVAGTTTLSTDGDVTLTTTTLAANQARQAILLCSGARTALRTITAPAQSKIYTIINATTGGYSVKLVGVGPTTGVTIVAGESAVCAWNGSDFIKVSNTAGGGTFTDLTVSNSLTLSYGTANGVLYLNGSKVATSGSALTFDGTNLGVGTNSPSAPADIQANSGGTGIRIRGRASANAGAIRYFANDNTTQRARLESNDTGLEINSVANLPMYFLVNDSEQMRLTSTGLGIGTSSPSSKLDVAAVIPQISLTGTSSSSTTYGALNFKAQTNTNWQIATNLAVGAGLEFNQGAASNNRMYLDTSGNLGIGTSSPGAKLQVVGTGAVSIIGSSGASNLYSQWNYNASAVGYLGNGAAIVSAGAATDFAIGATNKLWMVSGSGSQYAVLDSSGNLGLGVTPSAWNSAYGQKAIQFGPVGSIASIQASTTNNQTSISSNLYDVMVAPKYLYADAASSFKLANGQFYWYIAPSGAAGSAAAFTTAMTLDASGNLALGTTSPNLSGGSAGSQVITVSASSSGRNGILELNGTRSTSGDYVGYVRFFNNAAATPLADIQAIRGSSDTTGVLAFATSGTEAARIDASGNLGIGTSSPGQKLVLAQSGATSVYQQFLNNSSSNVGYIGLTAGGDYVLQTNNAMAFYTGASYTERMRLDSSGNLGLGVTPNAWLSSNKAFQFGYGAVRAFSNSANTYLDNNNYVNTSGTDIYLNSGYAGRYRIADNQHIWYQAASGNAGDAITFTQAMTLTASGNLLLGTTTLTAITSGIANLNLGSTSANTSGGIAYQISGATAKAYDYVESNVRKLQTASGVSIAFIPAGTEAARIDTSGNLLVGTTSQAGTLAVNGVATSSSLVSFYSSTAGDVGQAGLIIGKQDNNTTTSQVILRASILSTGAGAGQINMNGANTLAFGTYSDARLKENIIDIPPQLANIMELRPVEFDYIESEGGGHQTGFIAQEMQKVYPDAVGEREDGMLTVTAWSKTEARLVKAIQEQQALIQQLTARVAQLESN